MFIYQSALTQMGSRIEVLNSELNHMHSYNPIEYVKSRLKTPESIMKKLRKNGHNLNIEDMIEYVNDIAGIRIISASQRKAATRVIICFCPFR